MLDYTSRDLFDLRVDALAHGCNTIGIMNAGLAKELKLRYPKMYKEYRAYCRANLLDLGQVHFYRSLDFSAPHIINVAIQPDLGRTARLEYVQEGLKEIEKNKSSWGIRRLGLPKIGCGLGGLDWRDVRKVVERIFCGSDLEVYCSIRD